MRGSIWVSGTPSEKVRSNHCTVYVPSGSNEYTVASYVAPSRYSARTCWPMTNTETERQCRSSYASASTCEQPGRSVKSDSCAGCGRGGADFGDAQLRDGSSAPCCGGDAIGHRGDVGGGCCGGDGGGDGVGAGAVGGVGGAPSASDASRRRARSQTRRATSTKHSAQQSAMPTTPAVPTASSSSPCSSPTAHARSCGCAARRSSWRRDRPPP